MSVLSEFIAAKTPKMNRLLMEGLCYHKIEDAVAYLDNFIKYSCGTKTQTKLSYLGYKELSPQEEYKFLFGKASKVIYDIAENDIHLVKFMFQYADEPNIREYYFYVPFLAKGNIIRISGTKFLVMPTLSDKVISIGERIVFINIMTAKYNFKRNYFTVLVNGSFNRVPLIHTELYKNQVKKLEDTTKAYTTVLHYLLANYGYTKTMEMLLGFAPTPSYDFPIDTEGMTLIKSTGNIPQGYIRGKDVYTTTNIKFAVPNELYNEAVIYCLGNLLYILDNFPTHVKIHDLDNVSMWRRLLGDIIHSGNHSLSYLTEKITAHFNDLNSSFDIVTISKLQDIGISCNTLMELLSTIFKNFNTWIMSADSRSLYNNKTYESNLALTSLTSRITRIVLDINKEELRINGETLDSKVVDKVFKKFFTPRAIFGLKKERQFVSSIEYSGDHLYFKGTCMVVQQESDFTNIKNPDTNTSERKRIVASAATVGSILGLNKKNPTPLIRANPYVNTDPISGTILPHPLYDDIVTRTDRLLANIDDNNETVDLDALAAFIPDDIDDSEADIDDYDGDDCDVDVDID